VSPPPGQLGTFAALGAAAGAVPLPWLPDVLARRLRGALVHDIAARHGVALAPGARRVLADPDATKEKRGPLLKAFAYLSRKLLVRFGPLALLPPLRAALETYVLGHLFDRYLSRTARDSATRLDGDEARVVRNAIDRAVLRVVSAEGESRWPTPPLAPEESRDELTRVLDGLLNATATIPSWLLQRLDAAFDETFAHPVSPPEAGVPP
jgi:hypothetical protein